MPETTTSIWDWCLEGIFGKHTGSVAAADPREAVSKPLTSDVGDGRLVGEAFHAPLSFIDAAPGNADSTFEHAEGGIRLAVKPTCNFQSRYAAQEHRHAH